MSDYIKIKVLSEPWEGGVGIYPYINHPNGTRFVAKTIEYSEHTKGTMLPVAPLKLSNEETQSLMDQLWTVGFRPSEGSGSAGSLRATEKHLDDMRKIVGKNLGVDL